jgi:hypothetical protein
MKNKKRNTDNDYVNNKQFFDEMVEWKKLVIEAESCDEDKPPVTEYIGECFLKIAEHLSHKPNFIKYPYRDEMIGDGIENCIMYCHNFNPEKSKNPFSYFTQIIYYAFLRRIEKEKKQEFIKFKILENSNDGIVRGWFKENYFDTSKFNDSKEKKQAMYDHFQLNENDVEKFSSKKKKTKKTTKKNLDKFLEDDKSEDSPDK